ncbi:hypothetical protein O181_116052 [Austropuccinia psidii MF-1]|uniref:Uncharacterized protein n=1 Tax=Austropuccinia psidii MF-1 TaxID=1389203 RepID=A0A9Q3PY00_9BASI|nr:hypothetical protein [Austropuccinia psidii MF-1]
MWSYLKGSHSRSALLTCSQHHLSLYLFSALPTLLTILMLSDFPPNTAYHPYACAVPSQHAPDTAYHSYALGVPSQHAPDTTYPYASVLHP